MRIGSEQIRSEGPDDIAMTCPDLSEQFTAMATGDPVELAPQHRDAGFRVDPRCADILVSEELLDVGDVHAVRQQPCRHGVAEQMRVDALFDPSIASDVAHHLSDPLAGIGAVPRPALFATDEERSCPALADMHGEQPSELSADGDLAPFAALAVFDDDTALGKADIFNPQGDELRDACTGLQKGLDHQAGLSASDIGGIDEAQCLLERQAGRGATLFLRCAQTCLRPCVFEHGLGLIIVDPFTQEDIGNLVGDALNVTGHRFSISVSGRKSDCQIPSTKSRIHPKREEYAPRVFLSAYSGKPDQGCVMKIEVRLRINAGDGDGCDEEVLTLNKPHDQLEQVGLSLQDGKDVLSRLQERIVAAQASAFIQSNRCCKDCGAPLGGKGRRTIQFRTPFGDVPVTGPRFYRCDCDSSPVRTFNSLAGLFREHVSPEMLYLETKWTSLVSFGVTVDLLKDVLPVGDTLNAETARNHQRRTAARAEAELGEERPAFIEGSSHERAQLPVPEGPIVVGVDGGYVRAREADREGRQTHFEVMVGKSIAEDSDDRYFGLVQSLDLKPKRRLREILRDQGLQMNQEITFLTDGGDSVRNIAADMSPCAEHVLDWFHITMRLTVLGRYAKGLAHHDEENALKTQRGLKRIKGYLWNGNHHEAAPCINDLECDLDDLETDYLGIKAFRKGVTQFHTYITRNAHTIPNYAERHRHGERVSTAFVESTVNTVVGKRFAKRQQMRWSKPGAHLMLQTRTRTLDGTLRPKFEEWYPGLATTKPANEIQHAIAA